MRHKRSAIVLAAAAIGLAPLPALALGSADAAPLQSWLSAELETAAPSEVLRVYVHAETTAAARAAVDEAGLRLVETFDQIGVAVADGTPAQIRAARTAPRVSYVEGDLPVVPLQATSHVATRGAEAIATLAGVDGTPLDGSGASIAIIDSGIDGTHPFFQEQDGSSKVVRNLKSHCLFVNFTDNDLCWNDVPGNDSDTPSTGGHGTHVAGIAAGNPTTLSDGRVVHGAAPGAKLVGLAVGQAISVYGGNTGLNWVLNHHAAPCGEGVSAQECPPIRVTNNSYGTPGGSDFDPNSTAVKLQRELLAQGVLTVWAAGNDGGDGSGADQTTNGPGMDPTPGILMVASYNDGGTGTRDGSLSSFSSRGVKGETGTYPDISAPGDMILSACRPYLAICNSAGELPSDGPGATDVATFNSISGTSMAAPHIAGIVAQLLEADPFATPEQVELAIENGAHQFAAGGAYESDPLNPGSLTSFDKGHGLVDVVAAYGELTGAETAPAPAAAACTVDAAFTDPEGDATRVVVDTPLPSDPSLDVVSSRLSTDAVTGAVTFTIGLADLTAPTAYGQYFDYNATIGEKAYFLSAERTLTGEETFALGDFSGAQGTRANLGPLTGSFDDEADQIRIVLAPEAVVPTLTDGTVIAGLGIVSRRQFDAVAVSFIPDADSASGACAYTVGAEHVVVDEPTEEPTPEPTCSRPNGKPCKGGKPDKDKP